MFIFYFLGVGPPCHSIVCQFWLCKEAQCVYLRCHLGSQKQYSLGLNVMGREWGGRATLHARHFAYVLFNPLSTPQSFLKLVILEMRKLRLGLNNLPKGDPG